MNDTRRPSPEHTRIAAVVTARCSSHRLPGKVLHPLHKRPMLAHTIERLRSIARIDVIVLATSTAKSDDAVVRFAAEWGVRCWRGPLDDVLGRIRGAAEACAADAVIRISGDSPLIDPAVVRRAVDLFQAGGGELVTNVFPRSFPKGQSVEILTRAALERLAAETIEAAHREHVTTYAYAHPERFSIRNFSAEHPRPELQLSVDTADDMELVDALLGAWKGSGFPTVAELVAMVDALPGVP
jgi:spore coat polysaccharide biosynthesis protein SpsF